jgi:hypothetical protein
MGEYNGKKKSRTVNEEHCAKKAAKESVFFHDAYPIF